MTSCALYLACPFCAARDVTAASLAALWMVAAVMTVPFAVAAAAWLILRRLVGGTR